MTINTQQIIHTLIKNIERRDAQAVTDMFADDAYLDEMVGTGGVARGKEAIGKLWHTFFSDVSSEAQDNHWDIKQQIFQGHIGVIERTSHFVYKGRQVVIDMVAIIELNKQGKIQSYKDYCDSRIFIPQKNTDEWQAYLAQKK
jgi:ketosteroid isomerase-like protein